MVPYIMMKSQTLTTLIRKCGAILDIIAFCSVVESLSFCLSHFLLFTDKIPKPTTDQTPKMVSSLVARFFLRLRIKYTCSDVLPLAQMWSN